MMPIGNIEEFSSVGAPCFKVAGPRNHWSDLGPSNGAVIFYDAGFSAKLRGCRFVTSYSKMLRQRTGQISAHRSSSKIKKNTHLRLFRPDQGPRTVLLGRC